MSAEGRFLAIIPARAGSKRLPGKNRRMLGGKPLIQWTIESAQGVQAIDRVCVTTDDDEVMSLADDLGADVPFRRPPELATDTAGSADVVAHAIEWYEREAGEQFELVILLQPTSPLRTSGHIVEAIQLQEQRAADAVVSVCPVSHSPLWCNTLPEDDSLAGFISDEVRSLRSQDLPTYYRLNGAIYIVRTARFIQERAFLLNDGCYAYRMPEAASVDIDTELDFLVAEALVDYHRQCQPI